MTDPQQIPPTLEDVSNEDYATAQVEALKVLLHAMERYAGMPAEVEFSLTDFIPTEWLYEDGLKMTVMRDMAIGLLEGAMTTFPAAMITIAETGLELVAARVLIEEIAKLGIDDNGDPIEFGF